MTKVLIVGNAFDDKWIGNLVKYVKKCDSCIEIDVFNSSPKHEGDITYKMYCESVYLGKHHFPKIFYHIPKVRGFLCQQDFLRDYKVLTKINKTYNVVNFHFLSSNYVKVINVTYKITKNVILTPWGSDVLRVSNKKLRTLTKLAKLSTYVSCSKSVLRFKQEIMSLLNVAESKLVDLDFGTELIDMLAHTSISKTDAKRYLHLDDKYIIACGYNASTAQNHSQVIDAIASKRNLLPKNLLILLQMTYGGNKQYIQEIENKLKGLGLEYLILKKYLSNEALVNVRKCADIFIHAQTTDANSGSLAEYLLCEVKVINGSWLKYPHREKFGNPYYTFDSFQKLGDVIVTAYESCENLIDAKLIDDIKQDGWNYMGRKWTNFYNSCV